MINRPKLSSLVSKQLPEFIRDDYPTFVAFIEAYYEWLGNQQGDPYTLRDIDNTLDSFIKYFKSELAFNLPNVDVDERFLLTNIKEKYLAKGSESSFKLLFRILFNKEVTLDYPGRKILRASDGRWHQDVSIFARVNAGNPNDIVGKLVDVITPTRTIRILIDRRQEVEVEVDRFVQISPDIFEFYIDRRFFGNVSVGDRLRYGGIFDATILATTSKLQIVQGGKDFRPGQLYPLKNGNGTGSIIKVNRINPTGAILSAELVKFGVGYDTDFTATVLATGGQTTTGTGQAAISFSTIGSAVTSINITNGGSGYGTTPPTVALSGGGFTTAATVGSVTIVGGVITSIKVATPGSGYATPPTVIITGGSGVGAAATATIGVQTNNSIFETTSNFNEQGFINKADYVEDITTIWLPLTTYATGTQLYYANRVYDVTVGGITSSTPPSHSSGSATNGSVTLTYSRVHGAAWDGTYSGEILREFYFDSRDSAVNPTDPAIFKISLGPLAKYPGYYKTNDGFLDDAMFIQDSRYYQAYSYVVRIDEILESYKSAVKTLVHPAGMALFGEYDIRNNFDITVSLESMLKILVISLQDEFSVVSESVIKDVSKSLEDNLNQLTEVTRYSLSKPLTDSFSLVESTPAKHITKPLADNTSPVSDSSSFLLTKPLAELITPQDSINSLNVSKALEESLSTTESTTFLLSKPLSDSLSAPTDSISAKNVTKPLSDSLSAPTDSINAKDFGKLLTDVLNTPTDSSSILFSKSSQDSVLINDSDFRLFTKYTSDLQSPTDSGKLFFNPYVADPYPSNYWGADYTEGESTF